MTPQPARRPALQRPGVPQHPFDRPVIIDDDGPAPAPAASVVPPPAEPTPDPEPPADELIPRLRGGRKSYKGMATTVTFLSTKEFDRVKHAYNARGLREGFPSMNDWMCSVILDAVAELEERYNDGREFTSADAQSRGRRRR